MDYVVLDLGSEVNVIDQENLDINGKTEVDLFSYQAKNGQSTSS